MTDNDRQFMLRAIELAQEGIDKNEGGPFGCVIAKDGRIVGEGCNQVTSTNDPTAHAEIVAIREACKSLDTFQLDGCTVYTSCEPCPMCIGAIYWARAAGIFYAGTRDDAAAAGFDVEAEMAGRVVVCTGFDRFGENLPNRVECFDVCGRIHA